MITVTKNGRAYFNMLLRTITPKRLSAPSPITIALSEFLVLLKYHKFQSERKEKCSRDMITCRRVFSLLHIYVERAREKRSSVAD